MTSFVASQLAQGGNVIEEVRYTLQDVSSCGEGGSPPGLKWVDMYFSKGIAFTAASANT